MDKKLLTESVLDPMRTTRSDEIFDDVDTNNPVMKTTVRTFIIDLISKFIENAKTPGLKTNKVFMIGSMLGFQYRDTSDVDLEVEVNVPRKAFRGWTVIPHGVYIPNTQHPINVFLLFSDSEPYDMNNCENAYDIEHNTWMKKTEKGAEKEIPFAYVRGISEFLIDGISLQLERAKRDIADCKKYMNLNPKNTDISEHEKDEAISNKINDLLVDKDALKLAHRMMFRLNNDGFTNSPISISIDYKYDDNRYSMNNLIYKYIDDFGYYEQINSLVKDIDTCIKMAKAEIQKNQVTNSSEDETKQEIQKAVEEGFKPLFRDIDGNFYEF